MGILLSQDIFLLLQGMFLFIFIIVGYNHAIHRSHDFVLSNSHSLWLMRFTSNIFLSKVSQKWSYLIGITNIYLVKNPMANCRVLTILVLCKRDLWDILTVFSKNLIFL